MDTSPRDDSSRPLQSCEFDVINMARYLLFFVRGPDRRDVGGGGNRGPVVGSEFNTWALQQHASDWPLHKETSVREESEESVLINHYCVCETIHVPLRHHRGSQVGGHDSSSSFRCYERYQEAISIPRNTVTSILDQKKPSLPQRSFTPVVPG